MHPLPEYPRPSMRRDSYVNLNGPWDYAITQSSEFPAKWDGADFVKHFYCYKQFYVKKALL